MMPDAREGKGVNVNAINTEDRKARHAEEDTATHH